MLQNSLTLEELNARYMNRGVEVLTTEGRILLHLTVNGQSRIKELMLASGSSYRGFYLALERLRAKKLVASEVDSEDRRVRIVRLA